MAVIPVPGSEHFMSRPMPLEQLRSAISPTLAISTLPEERAEQVDPLTYEIIRHRIWSITDLMGDALKRMSGSLVVTECNDFDVAITDEFGDIVQVGLFNTHLVSAMDLAIKWILMHRSENPGIAEGDMFLCNDPWVGGGLHQNDVALLAPLFIDGKLFAWTAAIAHQLDVGGVSPGSWTPRAEDVFWESLPTPPVKIVRNGIIQRDIEEVYLRRCRVPGLVALDLRAKMGANVVGHEHLRSLVAKYGSDVVKAVMKRQMNDAERRLRAKLRQIPDGSWSAACYQEQSKQDDRGLYKISLTLRKQDDHLTFDFTGTDPQSGMINCTYGGMHGGVVSALLPTLCGDIPWAAGGILRCLDILSEEGTLNNCTFPAAIGKASVASGWATIDVAIECISKMIDTHPTYRHRTTSVCCGTWDLAVVAGLDKSGQPFAAMFTDAMGGGYGAGVDHDGVDTAGQVMIPMGKMPDVEMHEFMLPVLYLWRREECDSGGPGQFRGGLSASLCLISYETTAPMTLVVSGSGKAVPMNVGLAGGYPGNTQVDLTIRHTNVMDLFAQGKIPAHLEEIQGEHQFQPCEVESSIGPGDVHYMHWQAGGGYGDPLLRDPLAVQRDVEERKVSLMAASTLYGVLLDKTAHTVDVAATASKREAIRNQRKQRAEEGAKQ